MTTKGLILVEDALQRIAAMVRPLEAERVRLADARGRILAEPVRARRTQPPADMSAMDGYAVRAADVATVPATLNIVGHVPAGSAYEGRLAPGEAVRIFTGAPLPQGADAIVIQEDTARDGDRVVIRVAATQGRHIRKAGGDFREGQTGLEAGTSLEAPQIALLAAMNCVELIVHRRPRIGFFSSGDELVPPGTEPGANQIVASNGPALQAFIETQGGIGYDFGIVADNDPALRAVARAVRGHKPGLDMLVTLGGASVGEHDLIQSSLAREGLEIDFWRIAMRPGKPLLFGRLGAMPLLGLPGNPVSSLVCALLFLGPAMARMTGRPARHPATVPAILGRDLPENDQRQDYLRAVLERGPDGQLLATPFGVQDSAMLSALARSGCLVVRPPAAPAAAKGSSVPIIPLAASGW